MAADRHYGKFLIALVLVFPHYQQLSPFMVPCPEGMGHGARIPCTVRFNTRIANLAKTTRFGRGQRPIGGK